MSSFVNAHPHGLAEHVPLSFAGPLELAVNGDKLPATLHY